MNAVETHIDGHDFFSFFFQEKTSNLFMFKFDFWGCDFDFFLSFVRKSKPMSKGEKKLTVF